MKITTPEEFDAQPAPNDDAPRMQAVDDICAHIEQHLSAGDLLIPSVRSDWRRPEIEAARQRYRDVGWSVIHCSDSRRGLLLFAEPRPKNAPRLTVPGSTLSRDDG